MPRGPAAGGRRREQCGDSSDGSYRIDPPTRLLRRRELQASLVGNSAGNQDGYRHHSLGRGTAAVIAGLQRPGPQVLVDGEHRRAVMQKHPPTGDQHLPVGGGLARGAGPAAGYCGVGSLHAMAAFDDVPVVGGEDGDPPGVPGPVQQRREVLDRVGAPIRATGIGAVQGIVDRVQHARDQGLPGDIGNGGRDVIGHRVAEPRGVQRLLMEQRRARQAVRLGQGRIPAALGILPASAQFSAQQG